jgi:hypothetical protein
MVKQCQVREGVVMKLLYGFISSGDLREGSVGGFMIDDKYYVIYRLQRTGFLA